MVEYCKEKVEYLRNEYSSLEASTNKTFNEYVEKYAEYNEKRQADLEKWKEKEILYAEDEKEQSEIYYDSDCKDFIEKMNQRYLIYLRFKFDKLCEAFPDEFKYFKDQNSGIIEKMLAIKSIKDQKSGSKTIQFSKGPILSKEEIQKSLLECSESNLRVSVNKDCVIIADKKYNIGDTIILNLSENVSATLLSTTPTLTIIIDNEEFTVTPEFLSRIAII